MRCRLEQYAHFLRLTILVGAEIYHSTAGFASRKIVFFVAGNTRYEKAFPIVYSALSIAINDVVDGAFISFLKDVDMQDIGAYEQFIGYLNNLIFTILIEDNDIIDIRAVEEVFVFLKTRTNKTICTIDIEFLVGLHYRLHVDGCKIAHLRAAGVFIAILLFQMFKPFDGIVSQMRKIVFRLLNFLLEVTHQLVGFLGIELRNANHANLKEFFDILFAHFSYEFSFIGLQRIIHKRNQFLLVGGLLIPFFLINAFLNKDTL